MKLRYKLVPDAEPNAPGEWRTFEVPTNTVPQVWSEAARLVCDRLPEGYHFVAYEKGGRMIPQIQRVTRNIMTTMELDQVNVEFDREEVFKILEAHVRKNLNRTILDQEINERVDYDRGLESIVVTFFCKPS